MIHGTANDYLVAGMLAWEPWTFNDLAPLFHIDTSGLTKAQLQNMTFTETVIGNLDARAVLDANGDPDALLFVHRSEHDILRHRPEGPDGGRRQIPGMTVLALVLS